MHELLGLLLLLIAIIVVIRNPHRCDEEVDERLARHIRYTRFKKACRLPLDLTDFAASLARRMRF